MNIEIRNAYEKNPKQKRLPKDTIAAGRRHTVGLKSYGTAVAVGQNKVGQCDVSGWWGIVAIAMGNSPYHRP